MIRFRWMMAALLLGLPGSLVGQSVAVDSATAATTASLRPDDDSLRVSQETPADSVLRRRSRVGPAALGFLAGAGAGLIIAHIVNQSQDGEGKLENYIGIPLALGVFTFMTVLVALGD